MLQLTWKTGKGYVKFVTFWVYLNDEIPAIFFKLGAWRSAKTTGSACLLRFSALKLYAKLKVASTLRWSNLKTQVYLNRAFWNARKTGEMWERRLDVFAWTENILKTKLVENEGYDNHLISSLTEFFSNENPKVTRASDEEQSEREPARRLTRT